jgi:hypothetical protein
MQHAAIVRFEDVADVHIRKRWSSEGTHGLHVREEADRQQECCSRPSRRRTSTGKSRNAETQQRNLKLFMYPVQYGVCRAAVAYCMILQMPQLMYCERRVYHMAADTTT